MKLAVTMAVTLLAGASPEPETSAPGVSITPPAVAAAVEDEEGSADGLALDAAIAELISSNYKLRARFKDIPEARADELTASLRNAPAIFLSGDGLPYGRYSEQRPGAATYEVAPAVNIDYSGKRRSHIHEMDLARRQVEARYQNAVRLEIERLYETFVGTVEARELVRVERENSTFIGGLEAPTRDLIHRGKQAESCLARLSVQRFNAATVRIEAEESYLQARRNLAALLAIPPERVDGLTPRGALRDRLPPPRAEELLPLALACRPDVKAQLWGIERNQAAVQVERSEAFDDAIVFYEPYGTQNNSPQNLRSSSFWAGGAGTTLPVFDRNQGEVAKARTNVAQTDIELRGLQRRIANEVQRAWTEYESSGDAVRRWESECLPAARSLRDETRRRYAVGQAALDTVLEAQQEYNEDRKRYVELLARHRLAMLRLNTVVGQRILP